MLVVNATLRIPLVELDFRYTRSGGPGGQNVNKVSSKAVLRWSLKTSEHLAPPVKQRMRELFPGRETATGELVISSQEHRDQERNREACLEKLVGMLRQAAEAPAVRRPTRPTKGSRRRRLADKKRQSARKSDRKVSE